MSRDWTKSFFRDEFFTPGSPEAVAAAPREVSFLWKAMGLKKGSRVLDVACGTGRHSIPLARRGASVVGLDATPEYLRQARRAARGIRNIRFERGDMRRIAARGEFDAAINLWTSFGYFARRSDDQRVLRGIARALKPGGSFLIDLFDPAALRNRKHWDRRMDGTYVLQEAILLGGRDPRFANDWTILRPGKPPRRARFVVRAYDRRRLFAALRQVGLKPVKTWSSLGGGDPEPANRRLVVLARRELAKAARARQGAISPSR